MENHLAIKEERLKNVQWLIAFEQGEINQSQLRQGILSASSFSRSNKTEQELNDFYGEIDKKLGMNSEVKSVRNDGENNTPALKSESDKFYKDVDKKLKLI